MSLLIGLVALLQLALTALLVAATLHLVRATVAALRTPLPAAPPFAEADALPTLTVQLPMRNERGVAARVIDRACALDWPRERLQIQVLDDSDDETVDLVDAAIEKARAAGLDVVAVRREGRAHFKAGALEHALATARGALILVLDADSDPPPSIARALHAALEADPDLAFAQARWSYENEGASLLTASQAVILDALMVVEQSLLTARRLPVQFNGTAGIWRREALERIGGWVPNARATSVTEDLDLAFRARLAGLRGVTVGALAVATELPASMAAFRTQQQRWVRGGGEVLRAIARGLVTGALPLRERATMVGHLVRHARQPLFALSTLWLPFTTAGVIDVPFRLRVAFAPVVAATLLAMGGYYAVARARIGRSPLAGALLAVPVAALSMGLAWSSTFAFVGGFASKRAAEFVRTPKAAGYRARRDRLAVIEAGLALVSVAAAAAAIARGELVAGLALGVVVGGGLGWVGFGSLRDGG
jgi:hypothetical protein